MEGEEGVPPREVGSLHLPAPSEGPGMKAMQQDSQYGDIEDDATHQQGHDHPEGEDEDGSSEAGSEEEGGLVFGHSDQPLPTSECERKKQRISCLECSQAKVSSCALGSGAFESPRLLGVSSLGATRRISVV